MNTDLTRCVLLPLRYRKPYVQARETLKLLLNDQLQRKRQQTIHTRQYVLG